MSDLELSLHETKSAPLLEKLASFIHTNTEWRNTKADLSLAPSTVATLCDKEGIIHGIALLVHLSPASKTTWLGDVVVSKEQRRKGYAKRIVTTLIEYVERERKEWKYVALVASALGAPLYPQLGFVPMPDARLSDYERVGVEKLPEQMEIPDVVACDATEKQLKDAMALHLEVTSQPCEQVLTNLASIGRCLVAIHNYKTVGAIWTRPLRPDKKGVCGVYIGPLVATSSQYAKLLLNWVVRAGNTDGAVCEMHVLALGESDEMFEEMGFARLRYVPYMVYGSAGRKGGDMLAGRAGYFALAGWELG